jgi:hypothetical protein
MLTPDQVSKIAILNFNRGDCEKILKHSLEDLWEKSGIGDGRLNLSQVRQKRIGCYFSW